MVQNRHVSLRVELLGGGVYAGDVQISKTNDPSGDELCILEVNIVIIFMIRKPVKETRFALKVRNSTRLVDRKN